MYDSVVIVVSDSVYVVTSVVSDICCGVTCSDLVIVLSVG